MTDPWLAKLSAYIDGELPAAEWREVERRLAVSPELRHALSELRQVVAAARADEGTLPRRDLWPEIARAINASPRPKADSGGTRWSFTRRVSFTVPQLAAAGVAALTVWGGTLWWASQRPGREATPGTRQEFRAAPVVYGSPAAAHYEAAIADLQALLSAGTNQLDSVTVSTIEQSLATIDQAIDEARRAVAEDSTAAFLHDQIARHLRRKLALLRQATQLVVGGG